MTFPHWKLSRISAGFSVIETEFNYKILIKPSNLQKFLLQHY